MKLKVLGLLAFLFVVAVVAVSQHPPEHPVSQHPPEHPAVSQHPPEHPPVPAQAPQPGHPHPGPDPIAQNLFPPEMVMHHRQALALSEEQKTSIKDELMKASARFSELQWQMQDEIETMAALTKGANVDEQRVLAELDKILAIEREVKRTQLTLSIRIKNKLTAEQQAKLLEFQRGFHEMQPKPPER